jgi:tetratricopeptide (TPR) repeat protein
VCLWLGCTGFASNAARVYAQAVHFAKAGQSHFAFMHYNKLVRDFPSSPYREQALFAVGEYYARVSNLQEAAAAFTVLLRDYPDTRQRLYALAYLLTIALKDEDEASVQTLEKQIIDLYKVSLIFRESKEITFLSPMRQRYKAVIQINKIEFYLEGKLFAKVSY